MIVPTPVSVAPPPEKMTLRPPALSALSTRFKVSSGSRLVSPLTVTLTV